MVLGVQDRAGQSLSIRVTWRGMVLGMMDPLWVLLSPRAVAVIGVAQNWVDIQALLANSGNRITGRPRSTGAAVWVMHPPNGVIVRGSARWGSSLSHSHIGCGTPRK